MMIARISLPFVFIVGGLLILAGIAQEVVADEHGAVVNSSAAKTLVDRYCVDCHRSPDAEAGLDLENFSEQFQLSQSNTSSSNTNSQREVWNEWEKMVKRLKTRQMPPAGADRPDDGEYDSAVASLETVLDEAAKQNPQPGRADRIRRLNRTEYRNAIRDLLAVDIDAGAFFPADESAHGFDNVTLGELPPVLLSRYITAAEQISRLAVGTRSPSPSGVTVRVPADRTQDNHVAGLPLGTRGGTSFEHHFPAVGEYELQVRLTRDRDEHLEGLSGSHDIDLLIDREFVHRFTVAPNKNKEQAKGYGRDDSLIDANLKHRFHVTAGPHAVAVTFPQKAVSLSEIKRQPFDASFNRHRHPRRSPALFEVSIVGPLDATDKQQGKQSVAPETIETSRRQRILSCLPTKPDEANHCAEQILCRLVRLAYRRPVTESDLVVPMRFFTEAFESEAVDANAFEAGVSAAISAVLVNPHFLFRAERQPPQLKPDSTFRISDVELASRLSFFIWSSIPDESLLELAEANRLHEPETLREQVSRMLEDERAQSLVTNFASQWLYLRNLDSFRPDMRLFPDFDDNLRQSLRRETELLFESVLRDDRSVLDLIDTDTTFLDERLAKHYGIPHVYGSHFRPVALRPSDHHRGGLLRHGSILAVTSYATRTSPTIRGNWILGSILGTPPPPPPPNVPSLKEKNESTEMTIRERLAEHRANVACASCHDLMDPVGFAFENFDAVGRWRIFDDGQPIDASGDLPDGTRVTNFKDLESSILKRPEIFVGTLTEKLLTFALGRGVEPFDAPAVRKVVRESSNQDYRLSSLIMGIVSSVPFQMRIAE